MQKQIYFPALMYFQQKCNLSSLVTITWQKQNNPALNIRNLKSNRSLLEYVKALLLQK